MARMNRTQELREKVMRTCLNALTADPDLAVDIHGRAEDTKVYLRVRLPRKRTPVYLEVIVRELFSEEDQHA